MNIEFSVDQKTSDIRDQVGALLAGHIPHAITGQHSYGYAQDYPKFTPKGFFEAGWDISVRKLQHFPSGKNVEEGWGREIPLPEWIVDLLIMFGHYVIVGPKKVEIVLPHEIFVEADAEIPSLDTDGSEKFYRYLAAAILIAPTGFRGNYSGKVRVSHERVLADWHSTKKG